MIVGILCNLADVTVCWIDVAVSLRDWGDSIGEATSTLSQFAHNSTRGCFEIEIGA